MNTKGIFFSLHIGFMFWIGISADVSAQNAQIAVAGDSSLANLVDVTTAELSQVPELNILDRADLDRLGQEQVLQAVLDSKDFSSVHLLPADGLVLLRAVTKDGKTGVFARLVAVQPGVILREVALPDGADPATQAQALEKEFSPYWFKLTAIKKGKIAALSLLGLRFEVDAPETRDMERRINMLLASRLSAEPDTLVLERWRLNDAVFEKTLSAQRPSPFWTGSSLIDGNLKWEKENNRINVSLQVRPPNGPEISISDNDTANNLSALVERLANKIGNQSTAQVAWKPGDEAHHFTKLGIWCLDNRLFEEGTEAIESALALGDHSRTTHMLQIKAYALVAYPDDLRGYDDPSQSYRLAHLEPDSLPQRVVAATRAAQLTQDYMNVNKDFSSPVRDPEDTVYLGLPVLGTCLRILWAASDNGLQATHSDDVTSLRHETQKLLADLGDKLLAQTPDARRGAYLNYRTFYAGLWHDKPEDTLAFYKEALKQSDVIDGTWIRHQIFEPLAVREPYLDGGNPKPSGWPFIKPPWIVGWDGRPPDEVKALWQGFIKELAGSSDPVLQCDALKCELTSNQSPEGRNAVLAKFVAFLQQHSDSLSGPHAEEFIAGFGAFFEQANRPPNGMLWDALVAFYVTLFKQHAALSVDWIDERKSLNYGPHGSPVPADLLAALNDYIAWYQTQSPRDDAVAQALTRLREDIYRARPELNPVTDTQANVDFLHVTRFCDIAQPYLPINERPAEQLGIDQSTLQTSENQVWFLTPFRHHKVICVDPVSMKITSTYEIPEALDPVRSTDTERYRDLEVSPQWLFVALNGQLLICSRSDNQWRALDLPLSSYKPRWVNQQLYLLYNARFGDQLSSFTTHSGAVTGSGLIHVSLPDGKCENLISSRRIPPQTPLDGHPLGKPIDLWLSSNGLNVAFTNLPIYEAPLGTNNWSPVTTSPARQRIRSTPGGALSADIFSAQRFGQMILLKGGSDEVLLSDQNDAQNAIWNFPRELDSHHYPEDFAEYSPIMRGDDLCFYSNFKRRMSDGKQDSLYYFTKGRKDGLKIPLAYDVGQLNSNKLNGFGQTILQFKFLHSTDYGLVLGYFGRGFWVVPWMDIDAYRAKYTAQTPASPATTK